jgi:hypothetical protein
METRKYVLRLLGALMLALSLVMFAGVGIAQTVDPTGEPIATEEMLEPTTEPAVEATVEPTVPPPPEEPTAPPPPAEPTVAPPTEVPAEEPTVVPPTVEPTVVPPTEPIVDPTVVPPTGEPTVVPPTEEPTEPTEELGSFVIYKLFCAAIDEQAENPCVGRVEEAEGTVVYFELYEVATGFSETVPVDIEEFEGETSGALLYYDVPFGLWEVTELVPPGYDAFAVPLSGNQWADGVTITVDVGAAEEELLFVNVPFTQEPQPTTPPDTTPPQPTTPPDTSPPDVQPPAVTPGEKVPAESRTTDSTVTSTVSALPVTGAGATSPNPGLVLGLELAAAGLLLAAALVARRHCQEVGVRK